MKKQKWLVAVIAATTFAFGFMSCKGEVEYVDKKADDTAPAAVTNFAAFGQKNAVKLTWTEPADEKDIYGYEISYNVLSSRVVLPSLDTASIIVAPGLGSCVISSLTSGIEYTFTIKTVDTSGNKSQAEIATATPTDVDDTTVPAPVSNLAAFGLLTSVKLTWTEAEDLSNIYGYEISYDVVSINRSVLSTLDAKSMIVAPGTGECTIYSLVSSFESMLDPHKQKPDSMDFSYCPVFIYQNILPSRHKHQIIFYRQNILISFRS